MYRECEQLAQQIRIDCLRMVHGGRSGHIGSMLSCAEILAVLYRKTLNLTPEDPRKPDRDRLIFSKGHGGAAVFATLAALGYFPKEWLATYYRDDGRLSGHISHHVPGVEFSTGSLGHGLPVACGMALYAQRQHRLWNCYVVVSDGDLDEGSSWEAIMLAGQHRFGKLCMIVDYNRLQALGASPDILDLENLGEKLSLFRWNVIEVADGHDCRALHEAFTRFPAADGRPTAVICRTVKGKGVSFMENDYRWHYGPLTDELFDRALREVEAQR
ncbi:Transketolase 2 [bioreactor metagenome]|uniref:Transketolase 2 n=1 Tax=bioreactor metagenome TaxID=1076179 RepID=A0A645A9A4_9ZZZZ